MGFTKDSEGLSRRNFLAGGVSAAASIAMAEAALAQAKKPAAAPKPAAPAKPQAPTAAPVRPVNVAVIGLGPHGRELLGALSRVKGANVAVVCDTYQAFLNRGKQAAPKAEPIADYRQVLEKKDVEAVIIATPTHQHKEIALAAIQAGKHVYCETPLAHTVDDARAIAKAGQGAKTIFQVGQQYRANPQHHHVQKFVSSAVLGSGIVQGRGQWHKKVSWFRSAPTDERQREINWRLDPALSPGLLGEIGIHSIDVASWLVNKLPVSVMGFGSNMREDSQSRRVPDTVQCVVEYPGGTRFLYDATLASSHDGTYEVFQGSDASVLLRDQLAWLFKEADAPLLGWEVYARSEEYGSEKGLALVADATKQLAEGKIPGKTKQVVDPGKTALFFSVESFVNTVRERDTKPDAKPHCGPVEGFQACVTALKANEAVVSGSKIAYQKEWFVL